MIWRIRGRQTFARLFRDGTRVRATTLWCTVLLDTEATPPRVAFSIGRAVGPASRRNRLRRQLRAIVREAGLPGGWWLFGMRPTDTVLTYEELRNEVDLLLRKAGTPPR